MGSFKYRVTLTVWSLVWRREVDFRVLAVVAKTGVGIHFDSGENTHRYINAHKRRRRTSHDRAKCICWRANNCEICGRNLLQLTACTSSNWFLIFWNCVFSKSYYIEPSITVTNLLSEIPDKVCLVKNVRFGTHVRPVCHVGKRLSLAASSVRRYSSKPVLSLPSRTRSEENMLSMNGMKEEEVESFDRIFPTILADVSKGEEAEEQELHEALNWFQQVVDYNVPHGKKNRGLAISMSYKLLKPDGTDEFLKLARILGWCLEMFQAFFLISDDIMDQSVTRRGRPCWFRKEGVGLIAFNDAILLESAVYTLLRKYFSHLPFYMDILESFLKVTRKTAYGQCLDMLSTPLGQRPDLNLFTIDRYNAIVKYKTAFYSFCLPVHLAMYLAEWKNKKDFELAEEILLRMGHFFQVQDDYLDCYGDPATIGKQGTDIEDGKCSWLVVQALQRVSPKQRAIIEENYAVQDEVCVKKIKDVYDELRLLDIYKQFEEDSFCELSKLINQLPETSNLPTEIFHGFMKKIYKRVK